MLPSRTPLLARTVVLGTLAAACGAGAPPVPAPTDPCVLLAGAAGPEDTLVFGLTRAVDPRRAPVPSNDAERVVFTHLYEPLIGIDCRGLPVPGLATTWAPEPDADRWLFTVRPDARWADGRAVSVEQIAAALGAAGSRLPGPVTVVGDAAVAVAVPSRRARVPLDLAGWPLALASAGGGPPIGSGPYVPVTWDAREIVARPLARGPTLRFLIAPGADPRDLLDAGADLLVSGDPAVRDYVAGRREWVAVPLPWSRTYVLRSGTWAPGDRDAFRRDLARDAVRRDARPAEPPFRWDAAAGCPDANPPSATGNPRAGPPRVAYRRDDPVARALAERIVAVAGVPGAVATGVPARDLDRAVRRGDEFAYVVALDRVGAAGCAAAAWIRSGTIPLVDTRAWLFAREDVGLVRTDGFGVPVVAGGQ